jgi:hypothetical protein
MKHPKEWAVDASSIDAFSSPEEGYRQRGAHFEVYPPDYQQGSYIKKMEFSFRKTSGQTLEQEAAGQGTVAGSRTIGNHTWIIGKFTEGPGSDHPDFRFFMTEHNGVLAYVAVYMCSARTMSLWAARWWAR